MLTPEALKEILAKHASWLRGDAEGVRANLSDADLSGANLSYANLSYANLSYANLSGANLIRANLSRANLSGAYLSGAYLSRANLSGANLSGANLSRAKYDDKTIWAEFQIVPETGPFWLWKKLRNGVIAQLEVPAEAGRVSSTGRKCRVEFARVLSLSEGEVGYSQHDAKFSYRVGEIVRPDKWEPDFRVECSGGIHGFLRRSEAEAYSC
jgi:hypothetical protein